jgi:hypothetical protein
MILSFFKFFFAIQKFSLNLQPKKAGSVAQLVEH